MRAINSSANDSVKNKGYGSAAERLALAYAFENLGMESVLADSVLKNTRSQHVLEKVGFVLIGVDDTFKYYRCDKNAFKNAHNEERCILETDNFIEGER